MGAWTRRWWSDVRHLLAGAVLGLAGVGLLLVTAGAVALGLLGVGLPVLVRAVDLTRRLTEVQRRRVSPPIASPYPPMPTGLLASLATIARTPATWRDLAWLALPTQLLLASIAIALSAAALQGLLQPLLWLLLPVDRLEYNGVIITGVGTALIGVLNGVLLGVFAAVAPGPLVRAEDRVSRRLLPPSEAQRLAARVERLTATRSAALDASAVELRRIERDLHDGAQARLVALAMNLGMAEDVLDRDPRLGRQLVSEARAEARAAMAELRDLVRGIHPPLLAERGIPGALHAAAYASPVPVELDLRMDRRLPAPVESAAYFAILEVLTNAAKHSGATRVSVEVADRGDQLAISVIDDGRGGADPGLGSGLRGVERRLSAFDGTILITSPPGGPTVVRMEVPCGS